MLERYRSLAVGRAVTTNVRRLGMVVAFAIATAFLGRLGLPTSPAFFMVFAVWGAMVLFCHVILLRVRTPRAADAVQTLGFATDITFLSFAYALIGGAWWLGAVTHSFIVTFSLASLPRRKAGMIAGYAIVSYVVLLLAQVRGWVPARPFFNLPSLAANPRLGAIVVVLGIIPLVASAAVQNTFVRIMRRAQARYQILLQTVPDIIISTDTKGTILSANAAAVAQTGHAQDSLVGKPLVDFVLEEDQPIGKEHHLAAVNGESRQFELRYVSASGEPNWLLCTCNPIREESQITGVLLVGRDVRVIKEGEAALRQSEEKLRQAQKMEAVGRFAGSVAHDFSNLLTVIDWHSQFALEGMAPDHPLREDIEQIRKAGGLATTLSRQLLAFSRKQILQPRTLDLNEIVGAMERLLQRLIGLNITIRSRLADDLALVRADPGQLEQVLMNLCINARDAMETGGVLTIETSNVSLDEHYVETHSWLTPGSYVMLSVSDTGEGMDENTRQHLFEPFFTTKDQGKGTGLGLATVYGVVKQSGGSVEVYSEVGKGTVFKLYFPATAAGAPDRIQVLPSEGELRGTETILLADDAEAIRGIAHRALSQAGYVVLVAAGGADALRLREQYDGKIDLLVTDVIMPDMTGTELGRIIRGDNPETRILYMSGYGEESALGQFQNEAGVGFIGKPFSTDELLRRVKEVLLPA